MSVQLIVKYRGHPVLFHHQRGARVIWSLAHTVAEASVFTSEADAKLAARDYGLEPDRCKVESLNALGGAGR